MSKIGRIAASALAKVVYGLKVLALCGAVVLFVAVVGAAFAVTAPEDVTYSEDHFTVANSTDGEEVVITYEVETTLKDNAEARERKAAMDEMAEVSACANGRLDGYIQDNSKEQVESANLQEVVISCETDDVSIERIQVAGGMV